ncbi:hypothetical protein A2382_01850 [Candidatus Woesebacteria bacterium RIFOXYB1_FULL_38_16]|uniref:Uncharacterized protein n=1 Tax=Candidatus Woesebacteria bacterium RIFOXYB1_FULL_38_16 TaxID=1802538 RepID=A0A1F8CVS1_9BACT|nr:MAG: hypothetical protein A2191_02675 [Candidatus Woesebacteria bacterium RIFOXYA1_FULL_38_9]OGM79645.1 MAG: hypothetical protein A2382_01850 [Candidatus Woesebacteria bacterium RIFOXYB1_FULL_38_16]
MCVSLKVEVVAAYTEELMKINRMLMPRATLRIAGFDKETGACTIQIIDALQHSYILVSWPFVEKDEYQQADPGWSYCQKVAFLLSELGFSVVMYDHESLYAETQGGIAKIQIY